jgi:hypothetical protein
MEGNVPFVIVCVEIKGKHYHEIEWKKIKRVKGVG